MKLFSDIRYQKYKLVELLGTNELIIFTGIFASTNCFIIRETSTRKTYVTSAEICEAYSLVKTSDLYMSNIVFDAAMQFKKDFGNWPFENLLISNLYEDEVNTEVYQKRLCEIKRIVLAKIEVMRNELEKSMHAANDCQKQ
jgi:hypothetical protein